MNKFIHRPFRHLEEVLTPEREAKREEQRAAKEKRRDEDTARARRAAQGKGLFSKVRPGSAMAKALERQGKRDARKRGYSGVVQATSDFYRIRDLPYRELDLKEVTDVTPIFRKKGGTMDLRPIQSAALIEAARANGLFGPIKVGGGKTLILLLMAEAMDSERTVLLIPSSLKEQLLREIDELYGKHFNLPLERIVKILKYSELSLAKNSELLNELDPDLIVMDEAHKVSKPSARQKRLKRYLDENPHCRIVVLTGTITNKSIKDYAYLLNRALRKNSPLPDDGRELALWAAVLDVNSKKRVDPGALKQLLKEEDEGSVRKAFRRRLTQTQGVVSSQEEDLGVSLQINPITPKGGTPREITEALEEVIANEEYNGEVFSNPISLWRFRRQVSSGFYLRWTWPSGEPDAEDIEWLEARAAWNKAVREKLKTAREGMDSPLLLWNAAERWHKKQRGEKVNTDAKLFPCEEWEPWSKIRGRYKPSPPSEAVWLSDAVLVDAVERARAYVKKGRKVIIWYENVAAGEKLAELSGFPMFGAGTDASNIKEDAIICSYSTQGTGKNLQFYNTNIATTLPPNGKEAEQAFGRTHRPGQGADEVIIDYYAHTESLVECMNTIIRDSYYIEETTGGQLKVLYADGLDLSRKRDEIKKEFEELDKEQKLELFSSRL